MNRAFYIVLSILLAQRPALAEDGLRMPNERQTSPRFIPLPGSGMPTTRDIPLSTATYGVRSDNGAMQSGYMRLDRRRNPPVMLEPQIVTPELAAPSDTPRVIYGGTGRATTALPAPTHTVQMPATLGQAGDDSIASLFSLGNAPRSFRDALTSGISGKAGTTALPANHHWPLPVNVAQKVSSDFGFRSHPLDHETKFHGGIDIAAAIGTPVLATADGMVSAITNDATYGLSITLLHMDGSESKYGHLSKAQVTEGARIKAGQPIGLVGATGHVTGPHLDYRIAQDGVNIDPMSVLLKPANVPIEKHPEASNASPLEMAPSNASDDLAARVRTRNQTFQNGVRHEKVIQVR